jgi:LPS sulfotransferase NodH
MTHGYLEAEAADWRYAVLSMVDQIGQVQRLGSPDIVSKKVDDVTYHWADRYSSAAEASLYSFMSVFDGYRLRPLEFM